MSKIMVASDFHGSMIALQKTLDLFREHQADKLIILGDTFGTDAEEMVEMNLSVKDIPKLIQKLEKDMHSAAKVLDFERAAEIRDQLKKLREMIK